jgi:exodeoxyribonuclease VII small subunit
VTNRKATYEENIKRLEEIVRRLEQGDISLEEGLTYFEEGIGLVRICQQQLDRVAQKIQVLTQDGQLKDVTEEYREE